MEIVRASIAHAADVLLLIEEYYEAVGVLVRDSPERVRGYLRDESAGVWLAYDGAAPAGCVVLRGLPELTRAAECKRLYVRPAFRGVHVADQMLDAMEAHARSLGLDWIYLDSKDDLREAIRLYRRRGYAECERYNSNPQATVFLRKDLRQASAAY